MAESKEMIDITTYDDLQPVTEALMERWLVPGVTVGILKDGEVRLHAFGVASIETNQPTRVDTLLQIGSISKVFTATLVMQLVEEGKLDLDTPVSTYLPDLKLKDEGALKTINMRHLLTHTSGIFGDYFDDFGNGDDALSKAIDQYGTLRQVYNPGELWSYCNSGFNLAGAVIEKLLEVPYEQAIKERIFEPLGMDHSTFFAHEAITFPAAVGHVEPAPGVDEMQVSRNYALPRAVNPAGGIISTVEDLLKFAEMHLNDGKAGDEQIIKPETAKAMQEVQTKAANFADEWCIGWDLRTANDGSRVIGHGGSTNGFQARLSIAPKQKYAIAVLTNGDRGWAVNNAVAEWGLLKHCGIEFDAPEHVTLTDEEMNRIAGVYTNPNADITISVEDGGFRLDMVGKDPDSDQVHELPPDYAAPISADEIVLTTGAAHGMRGDIISNADGSPRFFRFGGRVMDPKTE